jgi:hypothetical protein
VIAYATIRADGTVNVASGFASLSPGTLPGIWNFTLINTPPIGFILPLASLTLGNIPGEIGAEVTHGLIGTFVSVFTTDAGGNPTNQGFSVVVYDLSGL